MRVLKYQSLFILVGILMMGCSDEQIESPSTLEPSLPIETRSLNKKSEDGSFSSPLFDLESTPNGDLYVVDAGAGIKNQYGATVIEFPGLNSIASIGQKNLWAITGAPDAAINVGQGVYRISNGKSRYLADLYAYDQANNPDGGEIGSNPYSIVSLGGEAALVADAGANDLLRITDEGQVELIAVFPRELTPFGDGMIPAEAVPTSVVVGSDGYYYVGELKGFPSPVNGSNIWKVAPDASGAMCGESPDCVKAFAGGFTSIIDMVLGPDDKLYVAELESNGWLALETGAPLIGGSIKVCDTNTMTCETIATGIIMLTAIEFDKDGQLWATRNSLIPGLAEVFQVQ